MGALICAQEKEEPAFVENEAAVGPTVGVGFGLGAQGEDKVPFDDPRVKSWTRVLSFSWWSCQSEGKGV